MIQRWHCVIVLALACIRPITVHENAVWLLAPGGGLVAERHGIWPVRLLDRASTSASSDLASPEVQLEDIHEGIHYHQSATDFSH